MFVTQPASPRVGFEQRWIDLCNREKLSLAQKCALEEFMSDLQDAAHESGLRSAMGNWS